MNHTNNTPQRDLSGLTQCCQRTLSAIQQLQNYVELLSCTLPFEEEAQDSLILFSKPGAPLSISTLQDYEPWPKEFADLDDLFEIPGTGLFLIYDRSSVSSVRKEPVFSSRFLILNTHEDGSLLDVTVPQLRDAIHWVEDNTFPMANGTMVIRIPKDAVL